MKHLFPAMPLLLIAACSAPDVSGQVATFDKAVNFVAEHQLPAVEAAAAQEFAAARRARIVARQDVMQTNGKCGIAYQRLPGSRPEHCQLVQYTTVTIPGMDATEVRDGIYALRAYSAALREIAHSTAAAEASGAAGRLMTALAQFQGSANSDGLRALGKAAGERRGLAEQAVSLGVEQARHAALRRTVNQAGPVVRPMIDKIIAYYDTRGSTDFALFRQIALSEDAAKRARTKGSVAAYEQALNELEQTHRRLVRQLEQSPAYRFRLIADAHDALARQVASQGEPAEVIASIGKLADLAAEIQ